MLKRGCLLLIIVAVVFVYLTSNVFSLTNNESLNLRKAYACLTDKIGNDCSSLNYNERAPAILALGDYKNCKDSLLDYSLGGQCWPSSNCNIKDTAISLMALKRVGYNTQSIRSWLLNQSRTATDLTWFLQIDSSGETNCKITYDSKSYNVLILDNKKVQSGAGNCLSVSDSGYWLKISPSCIEKDFIISCDKNFETTLLYKSPNSNTIFVSQVVNSATYGGEIVERVVYKCFKTSTSSSCDYEGTLWAAVALYDSGVNVDEFLPYLTASYLDYKSLFPESFLYIITNSDEFFTRVIRDNYKNNFWNVGSYGKFFSTALALMALYGQDTEQTSSAKSYLLSGKPNVQNSDGCWGSFRETAFLIYAAGWSNFLSNPTNPRPPTDYAECTDDSDCNSGERCKDYLCIPSNGATDTNANQTGTPDVQDKDCIRNGKFCVKLSYCSPPAVKFYDLTGCSGLGEVCCSHDYSLKSCASLDGYLCNFNQRCPSNAQIFQSSDSKICCSQPCTEVNDGPPEDEPPLSYTCTSLGGFCKSSCSSKEKVNSSLTCPSSNYVCCFPKKTSGSWWIWILIILILIAVLTIIFRDRIRMLIFKSKKDNSDSSDSRLNLRPSYPPRPPLPPRFRVPSIRGPMYGYPLQNNRPSVQRPVGSNLNSRTLNKDKEFEETIKKLKEMSK
ncbi:MAG: hypothetical protein QXJ28_03425 [Candidatus Pacearchaeota archaeon]